MRKALLRSACQAQSYSTRPLVTSTITTRLYNTQSQRVSTITQRAFMSSSRRLYSSEQADNKDAETPAESTEKPAEQNPIQKELEAAKKEIVDLKDKYLRSVADFRNLQVVTDRKIKADKEFAISKFARDLLDSVDNLDRALGTVPEAVIKASGTDGGDGAETEINKDLQNLYDGLKMTESVLMNTLAKHGLERFDPSVKGDKFDPNVHDATFMAPQPGKEDGTVFTTIQKGFILNGRVVRAAKVGVVKNS